ncbi:hypothetical protein ACF0H5_010450 [Mactra antiquata]
MQGSIVIVCLLISLAVGDKDDWKKNIEYFEQVHLECAKFNEGGTILSVQAWILPNGDVRHPWQPVEDKHVYITDNGFSLKIDRLDDADFGIYYCVVDKGINNTDVIKIGINVDGPYFGPEMKEELIHDAKIGGIAAGCAVVLLVILWVACGQISRKRLKANYERKMASRLSDIDDSPRSGDDSVYYIADGMSVPNSPEKSPVDQQQFSPDANLYHSIDTLEKVKSNENKPLENTAL